MHWILHISFFISMLWMGFTHSAFIPDNNSYIVSIADARVDSLNDLLTSRGGTVKLAPIYPALNLYRLETTGDASALLDQCIRNGDIDYWYPDRPLRLRAEPNDPMWSVQWDMERIGMPDAWDITTGGTSVTGDTVVIAILDDGFQLSHPDLEKAFWKNLDEIPGDMIDNDLNGYVDDHAGINIQTGNDEHEILTHGTAVAGIIGATGNNGEGIAGVNWQVKLLAVSGIEKESDVIEGYGYVRSLRSLHNTTDGNEGAFVVATNLSAGIDNAWPEDHAAWCAVYDDLGSVGILNIAATTNQSVSVDEEGDIPSTCPSQYLISVTNTDINDQKLLFAGYGPVHVDLAAPGTSSRTTDVNSDYQDFPSTSAAAPHVAGGVALVYSTPCLAFADLARENPASAALQLRSILLARSDKLPGLEGIIASGGRLNVYQTLLAVNSFCGVTTGDLEITRTVPNPYRGLISVSYQTGDFSEHEFVLYDMLGHRILKESVLPASDGEKIFKLDTAAFPAGVYVLMLQKDNVRSAVRIVVP